MNHVYDHRGTQVYESNDPDAVTLHMWALIARDIVDGAPIIGYTNDVVQANARIPVDKLKGWQIDALKKEGIL